MTDTWETRRVRGNRWSRGAAAWSRPSVRHDRQGHDHGPGCACPTCRTLAPAVRPRFFAGQLLTDTELTALQTYVIDKQRLHNLHLHGWGVVCGLQLECDDCGDGVILRPGYAIDPCGRDVVVPCPEPVDVLALVQACRDRQPAPVCDPPRTPELEGCDRDETWCITLRYREQHVRPVTPIGATRPSAACSCGGSSRSGGCSCGGSGGRTGWECTCGSGGSRSVGGCGCQSPAPAPAPTTGRSPECEPTQTLELHEVGVCRSDDSCHDLGARLAGTFPMRVVDCVRAIRPIFARRLSTSMQMDAGRLLLNTDKNPSQTRAHEAVCALLDGVIELYERDPMRTTCVLPAELRRIDCHDRREGETLEEYRDRLVTAIQTLVLLVVAYLRDCVCYHALAPCPIDPCDDRVVLGCVTLRDGKVVDICNLSCRRYAGSFVSRNYWLPVGPVLSWAAGLVCCLPLLQRPSRRREWDRADAAREHEFVTHDVHDDVAAAAATEEARTAPDEAVRVTTAGRARMPLPWLVSERTERLRNAVARDDFALLGDWRRQLRRVVATVAPERLLARLDERLADDDLVDVSRHVGSRRSTAQSSLRKAGLKVKVREVSTDEEVPVFGTGILSRVAKGDTVTAYVRDGTVIGFGRITGNP